MMTCPYTGQACDCDPEDPPYHCEPDHLLDEEFDDNDMEELCPATHSED